MSQSLEQDIQNWMLSKMILYNLATTSKRSNAPEVAFYPYSGMRHTATSLALLGKIRDHFCLPAVPAAQLKVSACNGNFSGARASHSTTIAAQQHAQGVSGTSSGGVAVTGESYLEGVVFQ